jgi:hypothetical protein
MVIGSLVAGFLGFKGLARPRHCAKIRKKKDLYRNLVLLRFPLVLHPPNCIWPLLTSLYLSVLGTHDTGLRGPGC